MFDNFLEKKSDIKQTYTNIIFLASAKNYKTRWARELDRKTRHKIWKGTEMTALRFQTDGWQQTSPAPLLAVFKHIINTKETGKKLNQKHKMYMYMYTNLMFHTYVH